MYTLYAGATKMLLHIDKNFTMGILISSPMVFICANMKLCIKIIFLNFISINGSYEKLVYYIFQNVKLGIPRHPVSDYGTFFCTNQNLHIPWMKTKYISAFLLLVLQGSTSFVQNFVILLFESCSLAILNFHCLYFKW